MVGKEAEGGALVIAYMLEEDYEALKAGKKSIAFAFGNDFLSKLESHFGPGTRTVRVAIVENDQKRWKREMQLSPVNPPDAIAEAQVTQ